MAKASELDPTNVSALKQRLLELSAKEKKLETVRSALYARTHAESKRRGRGVTASIDNVGKRVEAIQKEREIVRDMYNKVKNKPSSALTVAVNNPQVSTRPTLDQIRNLGGTGKPHVQPHGPPRFTNVHADVASSTKSTASSVRVSRLDILKAHKGKTAAAVLGVSAIAAYAYSKRKKPTN